MQEVQQVCQILHLPKTETQQAAWHRRVHCQGVSVAGPNHPPDAADVVGVQVKPVNHQMNPV